MLLLVLLLLMLLLWVLLIVVDVELRLLHQLVENGLGGSGGQLLLGDAGAMGLLHLLLGRWFRVVGGWTHQSRWRPEVVVAVLRGQLLLLLLVVDTRLLVVAAKEHIGNRSWPGSKVVFSSVIRSGIAHIADLRFGGHRRRQCHHLALNALSIMLLQNVTGLVLVLRSERHMNTGVTVVFLRVRVDNSTQGGGFYRRQGRNRILDDFLLLLFFLLVVVVVQRSNWRLQVQLVVLILLVVYIEHVHLLLLLLLLGHNRLRGLFR